jgi:16S rRNA (cytidine1402-2'-O)-methyltransferase
VKAVVSASADTPETLQGVRAGALVLYACALDTSADPHDCLPPGVLARLRTTRHFVVENCRSARRWLSRCGWPGALSEAQMIEWNEHHAGREGLLADYTAQVLALLRRGHDVGLLSEAGVPAVADPGSLLVARVHEAGLRVVPLVGPSSLLMALMASGLNGQHFEFVGYLPVDAEQRAAALCALELRCWHEGLSVAWIETPYRNDVLLETALRCLRRDTLLTVASAIGSPAEFIVRKTLANWASEPWRPGKNPAVFVMGFAGRNSSRVEPPTQRRRISRVTKS